MRLVDADAEVKKREKLCEEKNCEYLKYRYQAMCKGCSIYEEIEVFDSAEEVEAEPVRHGRWITIFPDTAKCLCCGWWQRATMYNLPDDISAFSRCYRFCTSCGAQMDGGDADA